MMAFCRFGSLRSCSRLQISSFSLAAVKQYCPSLYVTTQGSHNEMKLSDVDLISMHYLAGQNKMMTNSVYFPSQKATFISQPNICSAVILKPFHVENSLSHCSDRSGDIMQYKCPSRLTDDVNLVILDNVTSITSFYDCPVSAIIDSMKVPTKQKSEVLEGPGRNSSKMEASIIMKIRHKKMKKHKLKKLRKKMYFVWRKRRLARKAKRMKLYFKELDEIKKSGDTFSAEQFVQEQLAKAKKGGYSINVLDSKVEH